MGAAGRGEQQSFLFELGLPVMFIAGKHLVLESAYVLRQM
jgi:hypothetical protein